jgi:uncharacterized protein (TIGR02757 family)
MTRQRRALKRILDGLYRDFNHAASAPDPVHVVRQFADPADQEVVGFCAAALAFGNVSSILRSLERLIAPMGESPAAFVRAFDPAHDAGVVGRLGHRWARGTDLVALLWILRRILEGSGSIERFFLEGHDSAAPDVGASLESFSERALAMDVSEPRGTTRPGVGYFFPRPSRGSACKRLNLFLRWMVRRDAVDLGTWTHLSPAQLIVPLDTHVIRVGRALGLTRYRSPGWKMASDITASLRAIDPLDPVRYDFSLCHVAMRHNCGIDGACGDEGCPLKPLCVPVEVPRRVRR